jgi:hypothetical protein
MLILAVMLPGKALATSWVITPGGSDSCNFNAGQRVCFVDLASDTTSDMIDTRLCENYSFHWISNIAATSHDNDVVVRWSLSPTVSANTSEISNNATLTGDPATNLDVLAGYDAPWLYVDVTTYTSGTGRGSLQCFKRAE